LGKIDLRFGKLIEYAILSLREDNDLGGRGKEIPGD
jgi:hypothetical protein